MTQQNKPIDLDADVLELFAEELPGHNQQNLPPNSLSTLGCECGLSTFFCFGCGID